MIAATTAFELGACAAINRLNRRPRWSLFFGTISRLGDGVFWYVLIAFLPVAYGSQDLWVVAHTLTAGACCTVLYKSIKGLIRRERPCAVTNMYRTVEPLDRFSFPSGHTLHAVAFTMLLCDAHPELAILLVPFTILVACSRLVLGLHYPSDVILGGVIGAVVAKMALLLAA